jgi:chemotaxis protein CheX
MNPSEVVTRGELVEMIEAATLEVFQTMLNMEISPGEAAAKLEGDASSGLVSLIGLAGPWVGTGCLACTGRLACRLSSQFLGTPVDSVNDEVLDAVGEITNMIVGNVKTVLEEKAGPMGLSTPTVIFGRNFQMRSARIHEWTAVPFQCGDERLYVQICLAPNEERVQGTIRPGFQMPHVLNF